MQKLKQLTINAINTRPHVDGIKKLFALMNEYPEPEYSHDIIRISCLGLLEMEHDWINLKKYMVEWKMVNRIGVDLLKRMRQRVLDEKNEEPNKIKDEKQRQKYIVEQLESTFEKYWQFNSPKKQAPNYQEKLTKKTSKSILVRKRESIFNKQRQQQFQGDRKKQEKMDVEVKDKKNQKSQVIQPNVSKDLFKGRSLKLNFQKFQHPDKKLIQKKKQQPEKVDIEQPKGDKNRGNPFVSDHFEKDSKIQQNQNNKKVTMMYTPQKINDQVQIQKPKLKVKPDSKKSEKVVPDIDFQMSAVRSRQQPAHIIEPPKNQTFEVQHNPYSTPPQESFIQEFAFRTNDKKNTFQSQIFKVHSSTPEHRNMMKQFEEEQLKNQKQKERRFLFRNFLTEQRIAMIESDVPFKNHFKKIFERDNQTPFQLLEEALKSL